jgi:hypothetical protein
MLCVTTRYEIDVISAESIYLMIPLDYHSVFLYETGQVKVDRVEGLPGRKRVRVRM